VGGASSDGASSGVDPDGGLSDGGASAGGRASSGGSKTTGGDESSGGSEAAGGATVDGGESSGGTSSTGGAVAGTGGKPPDPLCNQKTLDPTTYPACTTCGGGHCVPKDFLDNTDNLDACGDGVCLPDAIIESEGHFAPKKCTSVLGNEGRCSSLCLPTARALSAILPQDVCSAEERCAPCFNPNDGAPTGICSFGCDKGPTTAPVKFSACCGGRGECVPKSAVPGNAKDNLAPETCKDDNVCVPTKIVQDPTYRFPACAAVAFVPGLGGFPAGDGVCVPSCIVDATANGKYLVQADCQETTDKCVPCTNPLTMGPSGACL
jgi:hypothetical protein